MGLQENMSWSRKTILGWHRNLEALGDDSLLVKLILHNTCTIKYGYSMQQPVSDGVKLDMNSNNVVAWENILELVLLNGNRVPR